jgi:hypothetical protein
MAVDVTKFKAGEEITLTVVSTPRSEGAADTIERLMRADKSNKKALRRAQVVRSHRINRFNRGNRMWISREKPARVVRAEIGRSWTMTFDYSIAPDLASVAEYLSKI